MKPDTGTVVGVLIFTVAGDRSTWLSGSFQSISAGIAVLIWEYLSNSLISPKLVWLPRVHSARANLSTNDSMSSKIMTFDKQYTIPKFRVSNS